jgi:predicted HTH transcriptional regulator
MTMFDTEFELMKQIELGEDSTLELKEVRFEGNRITGPKRDVMADEFAAFANSRSGVVVFGVADKTHEIIGIPKDKLDIVEDWIKGICRDSISPPLDYSLRKISQPNPSGDMVPVIKMDIPKSIFVHKSPGGYWRREGSSKREMTPDVLARMFQQRNQSRLIRFDESPVARTTVNDLNKDKWEKYRTPLSPKDDIEFLTKMKLLSYDDSETLRATISGILIACDNPQEYIPNAFIQAVYYRGFERNSNYQLDSKDITGSLDEQVRDAYKFVERNMNVFATKSPQRIEKPQYAMNAVFEALVNAVAHRDYSIQGSKIRMHMFSNRLEIYSPGTLPNTMTTDSMPLRQISRNETLTSLLARTPIGLDNKSIQRGFMMDKRGEGVPIIITERKELSKKEPDYTLIDDSELLLTIYALEADV